MPLRPTLFFLTSLFVLITFRVNGAETEQSPTATDSTASPATPTRQEPTPRLSQQAGLINQLQDPSTEVIELSLDGNTVHAFFKEQTGPVRHGGIIFFPDEDAHQDWPLVINPLRTELPFAGWATLTLPMPKPHYPDLPKRTLPVLKLIKNKQSTTSPEAENDTPLDANQPPTADASANQPTDSASATPMPSPSENLAVPDYYPAFNTLAMSAIQALQQRSIQRIVLAGVGSGATWASAFASKIPEDSNVKLLLINAEQSQEASAPKLLELLPNIKITIIDLYSSAAMDPVQKIPTHAELRLQTARRSRMNHYHQSRLPEVALTPSGQPWLVRHTRGMLQTYVIKAEKDKKSITVEKAPEREQPPGTPAPASKPAI